MIIFETEFAAYFNKKIHIFLEAEIFYDRSGMVLDDQLDLFFPKHLIREQEKKCKVVMEDLFDWTGDEYPHRMTAFHEMGLWRFLDFMGDLRQDTPEFDTIYYDKEDKAEVNALWEELDIEAIFEGEMKNPDELGEYLHDITIMQSLCFEDADFLMLPMLSCNRSDGNLALEKMLGIDFDYYKELLPKDIRAQYETQSTQPVLFNDILEMLNLISNRVTYHGLHKDFWRKDTPRSEPEIQPLLDSLFAMYFKSDERVDVSRETDTGTGKIDFKFYKNAKEKVLIEVKLGSNSHLEKGLKKQLIHYMDAINYSSAFYVVICHSQEDIAKVKKLHEKIKNYKCDKNIALYVLDVSDKVVASRL